MRIRMMMQGRVKSFPMYLQHLSEKRGLEIGGPSEIFRQGNALPVYEAVGALDNCDFSKSTVWAKHTEAFFFSSRKAPGNTLFCDGSALVSVPDSTYDVVLSSHNLEHFANPVKALTEWKRVLTPGGALVLVLPHYWTTFDHRRLPTDVDHMFDDFSNGIGEDDLTHLPEILERHNLDRDPGGCSADEFRQRSLDNLNNRCLHHHVFDEHNSRELLSRAGYEVLTVEFRLPCHICILALTAKVVA
jgi:SAM-dependent methyltransferase